MCRHTKHLAGTLRCLCAYEVYVQAHQTPGWDTALSLCLRSVCAGTPNTWLGHCAVSVPTKCMCRHTKHLAGTLRCLCAYEVYVQAHQTPGWDTALSLCLRSGCAGTPNTWLGHCAVSVPTKCMCRHTKPLASTYHGYTILDSLQGYLYKRIILTHDVQGGLRYDIMLKKYGVTRECQISPTFDILHM